MITHLEQTKISELLSSMNLCSGVGTAESACSIAAINLALSGRLTDEIPECMSEVIGDWIIRIQDSMPDSVRNSTEWKTLLPLAAGTGRNHEAERIAVILNWLWVDVLPTIQPIADQYSFGKEWRAMCVDKTADAAAAARAAADAAADAADAADADAAAARAAAYAAAYAAADAAAYAAAYAYAAADAAYAAAYAAARADFWKQVNPSQLLQRLINCHD
jgi:hypothetical protein